MLNPPRALRLAAIAALSVGLVACSSPGAESTPSSKATTSPSASSTPSETPTQVPTPRFDAADTSTWLITADGIGNAKIGEESVAATLAPVFAEADRCEGLEYYEASGATPVDFGVITHPGDGGVSGIGVRVPGDIAVTGPVAGTPLTQSHIGLGSALDELQAAEPEGKLEDGAEISGYIVSAGAHWMVFEVSEAEPFVRGITVTDTLPPTGFCG
jgi:hypothetical protein